MPRDDLDARSRLFADSETYRPGDARRIHDSSGLRIGGLVWRRVDAAETYRVSGYQGSSAHLLIPFWFIAGAFAALPVLWLWRGILVGGTTAFDFSVEGLKGVFSGSSVLDGTTVFDDGEEDRLTGGAGRNTLFPVRSGLGSGALRRQGRW